MCLEKIKTADFGLELRNYECRSCAASKRSSWSPVEAHTAFLVTIMSHGGQNKEPPPCGDGPCLKRFLSPS